MYLDIFYFGVGPSLPTKLFLKFHEQLNLPRKACFKILRGMSRRAPRARSSRKSCCSCSLADATPTHSFQAIRVNDIDFGFPALPCTRVRL